MKPIKALFYIDSPTTLSHCVVAAEALREALGAHIVIMLVNSDRHPDTTRAYEVYDYRTLFSKVTFIPVRPKSEGDHEAGDRANLSGASSSANRGTRRRLTVGRAVRYSRSGLRHFWVHTGGFVVRLLFRLWYRMTVGQEIAALVRLFVGNVGVGRFIRFVDPDVIVLAEHNVETLSTVFVARGLRNGIPTVIIPFTIPNPLEPAYHYLHDPGHQADKWLGRLLIRFYPQWKFKCRGKNLIRLPALNALLLERLRLSSPMPWILNSGAAAAIAIDSEALRELYLSLGFPQKQLRVTGDLNNISIAADASERKRLLSALYARHKLQPRRPLVVCAFPPDQYGSIDLSEFEFPTYDALIGAWMTSFRKISDRANILIRPHPRIPLERLAAFETANIKISFEPTADLVPLCDLYVASISATIRWAISCGVPVINYDVYRFRYEDYHSAAGVLFVDNQSDFEIYLERFLDDPLFAAQLAKNQRRAMTYWGRSDGRSRERFAGLVMDVVKAAGRQHPDRGSQSIGPSVQGPTIGHGT